MVARPDPAQQLAKAIELARRAHEGQVDKGGAPYIEHPLRVMNQLPADDYEGRMVAVLHDVVEDCDVTVQDLRSAGLPESVLAAVEAITKYPHMPLGQYLERVKQNPLARRVKLLDIADNESPARLNQLAPEIREGLRKKYARARELLGSE